MATVATPVQPLNAAILSIVYSAIAEINLQLPSTQRMRESADSVLSGDGGTLDSLALANFIVILEQKLEAFFGVPIDLIKDDPFSPDTGHFRTVHSLCTHVSRLTDKP